MKKNLSFLGLLLLMVLFMSINNNVTGASGGFFGEDECGECTDCYHVPGNPMDGECIEHYSWPEYKYLGHTCEEDEIKHSCKVDEAYTCCREDEENCELVDSLLVCKDIQK